MKSIIKIAIVAVFGATILQSCGNNSGKNKGAISGNAAEKVYVKPGDHDEFYAFVSGGFSG